VGQVRDTIIARLTAAFAPVALEVVDDSDHHQGHSGAREGGESHFTVTVVAEAFRGLTRIQRQRLVNGALAEELRGPVHALSLRVLAPDEGVG
jgi:BolA protein